MRTVYFHHPAYLDHQAPEGHLERADRLRVVERVLEAETYQLLEREQAPIGARDDVILAHPGHYFDDVAAMATGEGSFTMDSDTFASPGTWEALLRGVGASCAAVDEVMTGRIDNAFSAHRPPGHHAGRTTAMGFCFFNHSAIAARHARRRHGAEHVAIIDFDLHHGNGTQDIFWNDPTVMYCSTHQMPLFPGTGAASETGVGNIVNAPLSPGMGSTEFKEAMTTLILPRLIDFRPDLVILSSGFDAHHRDPMGELHLTEADFGWVTRKLMDVADRTCNGRLVSLLEGGYDLIGLARSVAAHVDALMGR